MAFDAYGSPQYGLSDVKVANWVATNSYGTAVDIPSAQQFQVTLRVVSAELTGDDSITALASRVIGANIAMRNGSVSIGALEVLLGNTATSSIASPNTVKQLKMVGGDNLPYFGIVGKCFAEEGGGEFWMFLPKCRILGDITLANLTYGEFSIPEMTAVAVSDTTFGVLSMIERMAAAAITIPPANIV
jgi:hypothetical protein